MITTEDAPKMDESSLVPALKSELSLFDTTAIAVSSVAPAYSLTATIGLLIVAVGLASPAAILVSFVPVFFIAWAYRYLNRKDPNCGASYTWLSRVVHPVAGWLSGWVQLVASVLFCTSASILAGSNLLALCASLHWLSGGVASDLWWASLVGVGFMAFVTAICVLGIRWSANFQWLMVAIEYSVVLGFSIAAIVKGVSSPVRGTSGFTSEWFNPAQLHNSVGLAAGAVLGVFFFWGWDTAANLNEESTDATESPGQAGVISMLLLLFIFLLANVAFQLTVPLRTITHFNSAQQGDALYYFARHVLPAPWPYFMLVAVLSSTLGTTQTTLLPASRISLSMARDGVFPRLFLAINRRFLTPMWGTLVLSFLSVIGIFATTGLPSVGDVFANLIADIGVLVAIYYGATGIACAWAFRRTYRKNRTALLLAGVCPFVSGLFLFWVGYQVIDQNLSAAIPVIGAIALGVPLVILIRIWSTSDYFRRPTVSYDSLD